MDKKQIFDQLAARPERDEPTYHTHGPLTDTAHYIGDVILSAPFRAVKRVVDLVTGDAVAEPFATPSDKQPSEQE